MLSIVKSNAEIYNFKSLPFTRGTRIGGLARYLLMSSKAFRCSFFHHNSTSFLNPSKGENILVFSDKLEMNLPRKFTLPNND